MAESDDRDDGDGATPEQPPSARKFRLTSSSGSVRNLLGALGRSPSSGTPSKFSIAGWLSSEAADAGTPQGTTRTPTRKGSAGLDMRKLLQRTGSVHHEGEFDIPIASMSRVWGERSKEDLSSDRSIETVPEEVAAEEEGRAGEDRHSFPGEPSGGNSAPTSASPPQPALQHPPPPRPSTRCRSQSALPSVDESARSDAPTPREHSGNSSANSAAGSPSAEPERSARDPDGSTRSTTRSAGYSPNAEPTPRGARESRARRQSPTPCEMKVPISKASVCGGMGAMLKHEHVKLEETSSRSSVACESTSMRDTPRDEAGPRITVQRGEGLQDHADLAKMFDREVRMMHGKRRLGSIARFVSYIVRSAVRLDFIVCITIYGLVLAGCSPCELDDGQSMDDLVDGCEACRRAAAVTSFSYFLPMIFTSLGVFLLSFYINVQYQRAPRYRRDVDEIPPLLRHQRAVPARAEISPRCGRELAPTRHPIDTAR